MSAASVSSYAPNYVRILKFSSLKVDVPLVERWLDECVTTHRSCAEMKSDPISRTRSLPTRLLDCLTQDDGSVQLISTADKTLNDSRYTALSYVWGGGQPQPCGRSRDAISIARLSPAVRRAIRVTRKLGIHYLWVDSLVSFKMIWMTGSESWTASLTSMPMPR